MNVPRAVAASSVFFAGLVIAGLQHRTISSQEKDPTGRYVAITSYRSYLSLVPMAPGSSSDKPCFVRIIDQQGKGFGEIPVPMLQMAGVEWTTSGASIRSVGEWDFEKETCYYWTEDQRRKIFVKGLRKTAE